MKEGSETDALNVEYTKISVKAIKAMDKKTRDRIKKAIEKIPDGDIKPLEGHSKIYRLRVGNQRIIFTYPSSETALILKIAPRGEVYKGGF